MLSTEEKFKFLNTKCKELSDWLKDNFNPYTAIVITDTEVKIVQAVQGIPIQRV